VLVILFYIQCILALFHGINQKGRKVNDLSQFRIDVKNKWSYSSSFSYITSNLEGKICLQNILRYLEEENFDKISSDAGSSVISNDLKRRANDA
jgi:hypothetical protein